MDFCREQPMSNSASIAFQDSLYGNLESTEQPLRRLHKSGGTPIGEGIECERFCGVSNSSSRFCNAFGKNVLSNVPQIAMTMKVVP